MLGQLRQSTACQQKQMQRSFLSPRAVFIPPALACDGSIPAAYVLTWLQLRSQVQEGAETPPLDLQQLLEMAGIARSTLYRHLAFLKARHVLDWRTAGRGLLIISFATDVDHAELPSDPGYQVSHGGVFDPPAEVSDSQKWDNQSHSWDKLSQKWDKLSQNRENSPLLRAALLDQLRFKQDLLREGENHASQNRDNPPGGLVIPAAALKSVVSNASQPVSRGRKPPSSGRGISRHARPGQDAASRYRELTGLHPNRLQRELLAELVGDLERWDATLEHWQGHGWNPRNITGQLDLYQRGGPAACRFCQKKAAPNESTLDTLQQMLKELTDFK